MRSHAYRTPFKLNEPVIDHGEGPAGAFARLGVDAPFVFWHAGEYKMLHIGYDGVGYQTAMARSTDLIHWEHECMILERTPHSERWDARNAAGVWLLRDDDLRAVPALRRYNGRYWLFYHSYPDDGFEAGPASIGVAWTQDETLRTWHRVEEPVLSPTDGEDWERGGLYKECVVQGDDGLFYMFYNAKNQVDEAAGEAWHEQIGLATSADLLTWHRHPHNPVVPVSATGWDSRFASDPFVARDGHGWVMFYFGFDGAHAQEGIAFSDDLVAWTKDIEPILVVGGADDIDGRHAHKPSIVVKDDVLYHFYCAVRDGEGDGPERRVITVATSEPRPARGQEEPPLARL